MPQYYFMVSKQNMNIKVRCLQHTLIISSTSHSVLAAMEYWYSQRTLKYEYGDHLGHHLVLLLSCWVKYNKQSLHMSTLFEHLNYKTFCKYSTGMLIQSEIMYSYIMIMAAILVTILAHFYNVGINNKSCCSQHNMSISNALHLIYAAQELCLNQRTQSFKL